MAANQLFHSRVNDVVPWQAQYTFPSQATKMHRQTVKLPPKQGGSFSGGQKIRIEFPSDGYLNAMNSVLSFDLTCAQSIDTSYAGGLIITQTGSSFTFTLADLAGIADRATEDAFNGRRIIFTSGELSGKSIKVIKHAAARVLSQVELGDLVPKPGTYDIRVVSGVSLQKGGAHELIKSIKIMYGGLAWETIDDYNVLSRILLEHGTHPGYKTSVGAIMDGCTGDVADCVDTRRYNLNLLTGLMACKKLLPLKWMAAQFVLEVELASVADAFIVPHGSTCSYSVTNVNYIAELYDFDSTYDTAFFIGLRTQGVPVKFSSWRRHTFTLNSKKQVCQVHERARSVKMAFAVIRDQTQAITHDAHRFYFNPSNGRLATNAAGQTDTYNSKGADASVKEFQWRIGGKYFPAQPVNCENGGVEAYSEVLKALDGLGDFTFWCSIDKKSFASSAPYDGQRFIMAQEFEHGDISPDTISGINAEEQSDLALTVELQNVPAEAKQIDIFVAYDALVIIRDGNVVDLVL